MGDDHNISYSIVQNPGFSKTQNQNSSFLHSPAILKSSFFLVNTLPVLKFSAVLAGASGQVSATSLTRFSKVGVLHPLSETEISSAWFFMIASIRSAYTSCTNLFSEIFPESVSHCSVTLDFLANGASKNVSGPDAKGQNIASFGVRGLSALDQIQTISMLPRVKNKIFSII